MNFIKKIIALSFFATMFWGCEDASKQSPTADDQESPSSEQEESEKAFGHINQKWLVNEEMKPFIEEAETLLDDYVASERTDHLTLAVELKEKNSKLIKSCTMEGESHDALHEWLYPHIELLKGLEKAERRETADSVIKQLQASFETYNLYFQ